MRKNTEGRIWVFVLGSILFLMVSVVIIPPTFHKTDPHGQPEACRYNVRHLGGLLVQYAKAHDGRFPKLDGNGPVDRLSWLREVRRWSPSEIPMLELKCPRDQSGLGTSYEMNPDLSGKRISDIPDGKRSSIVLLYERRHAHTHHWAYYPDGHVARMDSR